MTKAEVTSCIQTITLLKELAYNIHGYMDVIDAENCKKMIELLKEQETPILTIDDAVSELMDRHYDRLKEQEEMKKPKLVWPVPPERFRNKTTDT